MERYRRTASKSTSREDKTDFKTLITRQGIVCACIFLVVLGIRFVKTDVAQNIFVRIKNSISYTVDYESAVKGIFDSIKNLTRGTANEPENTDKSN